MTVVLGVFGRLHSPTGVAINIAGFSGPGYIKAWLATLAAVLALVQLGSALVMHGALRVLAPQWIGPLHRWSGRLAVLATVPVALHCLYALGFRADEPRVLIHSSLGCLFYGAFVPKMLLLTRLGAPRWTVPVLGGAVFTGLVGLWLTSALWLAVHRARRPVLSSGGQTMGIPWFPEGRREPTFGVNGRRDDALR